MYLDSAYIVKLYIDEPESRAIGAAVGREARLCSSALAIAEVNCVFARHCRAGLISKAHCEELIAEFAEHAATGVWTMAPVSEDILRRTSLLPTVAPSLYLRAADAIHLLTAQRLGEPEIWTGDRQMLAAAPYFGIAGRSV